jgi:hypothetical protein
MATVAVSVTLLPRQMVVLPLDVMVGTAGTGLTVMVTGKEVAEQPGPFEIVTEYVPADETVMAWVVAAFDHR